jgi:hypothetical protein
MNERIRQLISEATIKGEEYLPGNDGHPTPTVYFDKEKFAELIVQECQTVVEWAISVDSTIDRVPVLIKEHFGVDE